MPRRESRREVCNNSRARLKETPLHALVAALALALPLAAAAMPGPYDENADAKAAVGAALAEGARDRMPTLIVFGANWCGDCQVLDQSFKQGQAAALIRQRFKVVKVDVGRFDRNTDLARRYEVPLKLGIPAVAVVSPEGRLLYATRGGELADARHMGDRGIYDFFVRVAGDTRPVSANPAAKR